MSKLDYDAFAKEWEAAWNSHSLERILAHYSDDIVFRSQKALNLVGSGELRGKSALRDYWGAALAKQPDLAFKVVDVLHGYQMMVVTYRNHKGVFAAETLRFDENGQVVEASACHQSP